MFEHVNPPEGGKNVEQPDEHATDGTSLFSRVMEHITHSGREVGLNLKSVIDHRDQLASDLYQGMTDELQNHQARFFASTAIGGTLALSASLLPRFGIYGKAAYVALGATGIVTGVSNGGEALLNIGRDYRMIDALNRNYPDENNAFQQYLRRDVQHYGNSLMDTSAALAAGGAFSVSYSIFGENSLATELRNNIPALINSTQAPRWSQKLAP